MQEVVLKLTLEQYNVVMAALNASVQWTQQNTAVLMATIQGQAAAQAQPLNQASPATPPAPPANQVTGPGVQGGQNVGVANVQPA